MADKKIIAVTGATGSQGGGLVRAILADPNGGIRCRAITRDASKDKAKALAAAGAEVVSGDLDNVESLKKAFAGAYGVYARHQLLGALLWREGKGAGQEHRRSRQGRRREARDLVDARRHAQADVGRRHAHADAAGASTACRTSTPRPKPTRSSRPAGDVPGDVVLLGQPLHVRPGAEEGRQGRLQLDVPDGQREAGRHRRPRTSARSPTASSRRAPQYIGKTVGIAGESLSIQEMGQKLSKGLGIGPVKYNAGGAERLPRASDSPAPTRWATCSRSIATSRRQ